MTKKEAIHFLYQIADEIRSFLDKTSSPKGQWTSHKRLEALSMAISALYDLFQAEEDGRLIIPPCKVGDIERTVRVYAGSSPEVDKCDCREQREKRGQEMKRVFAILLTAMLLTGCTSENVRAIQSSSTSITITTYNNYSVQGYTIREIGDGYVVTVEVNPK